MKGTGIFQKLSVIVFMLSLLAQTFQNELVWVDYLLNTDSYAALCVNKAAPEMNCNGHCQMAKKMEQTEDQDKQAPQTQSFKINDVVLYAEDVFFFATIMAADDQKLYAELPVLKTIGFNKTLLHPPATA